MIPESCTMWMYSTNIEDPDRCRARCIKTRIIPEEIWTVNPHTFPTRPLHTLNQPLSWFPNIMRWQWVQQKRAGAAYNTECVSWQWVIEDDSERCYKWHGVLQMTLDATNDIGCFKWHWVLQMTLGAANDIGCYKWHWVLQMTWGAINDIRCYK